MHVSAWRDRQKRPLWFLCLYMQIFNLHVTQIRLAHHTWDYKTQLPKPEEKKTSITAFYAIYTVCVYIMDVIRIGTDNVLTTDMNRVHLSPHPTDVVLVIIYWSLALCVTWQCSTQETEKKKLHNVTRWATMACFLSIVFFFFFIGDTCYHYVHNHAIYCIVAQCSSDLYFPTVETYGSIPIIHLHTQTINSFTGLLRRLSRLKPDLVQLCIT